MTEYLPLLAEQAQKMGFPEVNQESLEAIAALPNCTVARLARSRLGRELVWEDYYPDGTESEAKA